MVSLVTVMTAATRLLLIAKLLDRRRTADIRSIARLPWLALVALVLYPMWALGWVLGAVWLGLRNIGSSFSYGFREVNGWLEED
jgi:hypothetical protein